MSKLLLFCLTGFAATGVTALVLYKNLKQNELINRELSLSYNICRAESNIIQNQLISAIRHDGVTVDLTMQCVTSDMGLLTMQDIIRRKTLVYKFSLSDCSNCVSQQISLLRELLESNSINIVCLFEYLNIRQFKSTIQNMPGILTFYGVQNFPIAEQVYFILDDTGVATNFHLPDKNNSDLSKQYLSIVSEKMLGLTVR